MYPVALGAGVLDWIRDPIGTIKAHVSAFLALPTKWATWKQTAQAYQRSGTPAQRASATKLIELLDSLLSKWNRARAMMRVDTGLGVIPVVWLGLAAGASAVTLATLLYAIFSGDGAAAQILTMLQAGTITPEEAGELIKEVEAADPGGPLSKLSAEFASVLKVAAGAALLWVAVDAYRTHGRGRR